MSLVFAASVVVVVVVVGVHNFLSELLLSLVDICVKFISVLPYGEFLVVINGNIYHLSA